MTFEEVSGMLDVMNMAYPHFTRNLTEAEAKAQIRIWTMMLANDDPKIVAKVLHKHIALNKYPPTIAEIRQGIRELIYDNPYDLLQKLREQGKKSFLTTGVLVSRGENGQADTYRQISHKGEAFAELPLILQRYVKSPNGLQEWYNRFVRDTDRCSKDFYKEIAELQEQMDIAPLLGEGE